MPSYRKRRAIKLRIHTSGQFLTTVGRAISQDGSKLVPKDFYLGRIREAAEKQAQRIVAEWNMMLENWQKTFQQPLQETGSPFALHPHWNPKIKYFLSDEDVTAHENLPVTTPDEVEANAEATTLAYAMHYYHQMYDKRKTTKADSIAEAKNRVRNAIAHFPKKPIHAYTEDDWIAGVESIRAKIKSERGQNNYIRAVYNMLEWFFKSKRCTIERPDADFEEIFKVKKDKPNPNMYTADEIKFLLENCDEKLRLCIMMALNCGMYQSDMTDLKPTDIEDNYTRVWWTRSKEPDNPFKLYHHLWPETTELLRKYQGVTVHPDTISTWLRDDFNKKYSTHYRFLDIRKTANQFFVDFVSENSANDTNKVTAIIELSDLFLGHARPDLRKRYSTLKKLLYKPMNSWLDRLGEKLRKDGIFGSP